MMTVQETLRIVEYQPRFREAFKTLNLEWITRYFHVEPADERILGNPEEEILAQGGKIFFAVQQNADGTEEALGTCALVKMDEHTYELAKMAVTERARGRKLGGRLLNAAIETARRMGATALVLETNSQLASAIHLYRKAGFEPIASDSHFERGDTHMRLAL